MIIIFARNRNGLNLSDSTNYNDNVSPLEWFSRLDRVSGWSGVSPIWLHRPPVSRVFPTPEPRPNMIYKCFSPATSIQLTYVFLSLNNYKRALHTQ